MSKRHRSKTGTVENSRDIVAPRKFHKSMTRALNAERPCKFKYSPKCAGVCKNPRGICQACKRQYAYEFDLKRRAYWREVYKARDEAKKAKR